MYLYHFLKVSSKRPSISSSNATCYHSTINIEATEYLKVKTSANRDSKELCKTLSAVYYLLSVVSHKHFSPLLEETSKLKTGVLW